MARLFLNRAPPASPPLLLAAHADARPPSSPILPPPLPPAPTPTRCPQVLTFVLLFLLSFSDFLVSDVPVYFAWISIISYLVIQHMRMQQVGVGQGGGGCPGWVGCVGGGGVGWVGWVGGVGGWVGGWGGVCVGGGWVGGGRGARGGRAGGRQHMWKQQQLGQQRSGSSRQAASSSLSAFLPRTPTPAFPLPQSWTTSLHTSRSTQKTGWPSPALPSGTTRLKTRRWRRCAWLRTGRGPSRPSLPAAPPLLAPLAAADHARAHGPPPHPPTPTPLPCCQANNGLSVATNLLILLALTVGTRLMAFALIWGMARLRKL